MGRPPKATSRQAANVRAELIENAWTVENFRKKSEKYEIDLGLGRSISNRRGICELRATN